MKIMNKTEVLDRVDADKVETFDSFDSVYGMVFDEDTGENLESVIIQLRVVCEVDVRDLDLSAKPDISVESKRSAFGKWLCRFVGIQYQPSSAQTLSYRLEKVLDGNKAYGRKLIFGFDGSADHSLISNVDGMEKV